MRKMKRYDDFKSPENETPYLTKEELANVKWTKYVIVVPSEEDREELMDAFEHIHYSDIDTDNIAVNQLAHEYLDEDREPGTYNNIVVDPEAYEKLRIKR
jgi:predicted metal-dependent TIM-barrel fold hydrolase